MKKSQRVLLILMLISSLLVLCIALKNPQGLYSDSAWQLKALQQFIIGTSPSFNHFVRPSYDDLSVNQAIWITWWPPGTNLLAYPLLAQGIPIGISIRIIAFVCLILGSLGWFYWFSLFDLPIWLGGIFTLTLPTLRYSNHALFQYSAEVLVYAYAPWLILTAYGLSKLWEQNEIQTNSNYLPNLPKYLFISPLIGLIFTFGYILKYSLLFVILGSLLYLGIKCFTNNKSSPQKIHKTISYILVCLFCIISLLSFNLVNRHLAGTENLVTATAKVFTLKWQNLVYLIANLALALSDAEHLYKILLLNLQDLNSHISTIPTSLWIAIIGFLGGIYLLWLIWQNQTINSANLLAKVILFTSMIALFSIWSIGASVSYEPRHIMAGSLAILPLILKSGYDLWQKNSQNFFIKTSLLIVAIIYLVIPLGYGSIDIFLKAIKEPLNYVSFPNQIYNPWLATKDLTKIRAELIKDFNQQTDIWYLPEPLTALDLPGRAIISHADFYGGLNNANLHGRIFHSSKPLNIFMLLPDNCENNGKGTLIRSSFVQVHEWTHQKIEGSNYVKWTGRLIVNSGRLSSK
jgi:hypothetical protein